ncbi:helix-turn-helix domain-containing protein [Dactylosporangium aurantiacum]|uniref:helix-turn-helix domain-containing protein n=1 Tax=Dactylosporangium aurantiacum TaxID=35754 RepID=UPI0009DD424D|nr:helix-turn-helix transcriptional regulator [Dactylosporangium aurantiacum]MDG6107874.1 helix-turn-helix transcriptional regulator [Dactylosporangium aurantiacum]
MGTVLASLAAQLRQLRTGRGLSVEDLAAASGVSRSMISEVERGLKAPSVPAGPAARPGRAGRGRHGRRAPGQGDHVPVVPGAPRAQQHHPAGGPGRAGPP